MARRLKEIAKWINDTTDHVATITEGYCNTDRTPAGYRYITHPGMGRYGNKLVVKTPSGEIVCEYNSAETYANNGEVETWIKDYWERGLKDKPDSQYRRHYR